METKYTKGPWRWSDRFQTSDGRLTFSLLGADGFGILSCDGDANSPQNVNVADAHLIAAAPELLEACVVLIEWDEREKDHAVNFHARMALCDAALLKARAAIAKAEGRE